MNDLVKTVSSGQGELHTRRTRRAQVVTTFALSAVALGVLSGGGPSAAARAPAQQPPRRMAVVVGANAAPQGRARLRYAQADASAVARVLRRVGGYAAADVAVMRDPSPASVLAALDRTLATLAQHPGETSLLFYYSGHADATSLFPGGRPLAYADLRRRLDTQGATTRIGIIDSCRGGGWTGTRGLDDTELFAVEAPLSMDSSGSVLIASSSGLEDAHESQELAGGYFTHHWNAALMGAGDADGNGVVTLPEAFAYAQRLTIRDTARHTAAPQHPSFRTNLRGRREMVLADLQGGPGALTVHQRQGPIEIVQLDVGRIVLELEPGSRVAQVLLSEGRYLVRIRGDGQIRSTEVVVGRGGATVRESDLELGDLGAVASRGFERPGTTESIIPDGDLEVRFALGAAYREDPDDRNVLRRSFVNRFSIGRGFADHWQWLFPLAFSRRFDLRPGLEVIPWLGLTGMGFSSIEGFLVDGSSGVQVRRWFGERYAFDAALEASGSGRTESGFALGATLTLGMQATFGGVTLRLGVNGQQQLFRSDGLGGPSTFSPVLTFGSAPIGGRRQPLLQLHVNDVVHLDVDIAVRWHPETRTRTQDYLVGATFIW